MQRIGHPSSRVTACSGLCALLLAVGCGQSARGVAPDLHGADAGAGGGLTTPGSGGGDASAVGGAEAGGEHAGGEHEAGTAGEGADAATGGAPGSTTDAGGSAGAEDPSGGAAGEGGASNGEGGFCPPKGTPCKIMPLGDSITFGYGSTTGGGYRVELFNRALEAGQTITFVGSQASGPTALAGKPFPQANEGHSGYSIDDSAKTSGISPLVDQALARYQPNIVLLMIGTNDMHYALDLDNAPTRLGKLIDRITADAPAALVVVAKIPPANGAQDTPTRAYNAAIANVITSRLEAGKHLALVDMYTPLAPWSTARFKDSEHPNDTGYLAVAQTWYAVIASALR